jgi:hypothetical protein
MRPLIELRLAAADDEDVAPSSAKSRAATGPSAAAPTSYYRDLAVKSS